MRGGLGWETGFDFGVRSFRFEVLGRYANDDENFVLVVPLTCGTRFKKIVLELVLVLELDC